MYCEIVNSERGSVCNRKILFLFSEYNGKEETTMYPSHHSGVCPNENKSESPMARNRPRRATSRRDTTSTHGESPGERKVYITEEFDSTPGTWPRPLSYLSKYACPTGRHAAACARRSYYSLLRNWRPRVSTGHPKLWAFPANLVRGFRYWYSGASGMLWWTR